MTQQTAVEWLIIELNQELNYIPITQWDRIRDIVQRAKQMEKEQHQETFKHSRQAKIFEDNKPPVWKSFDEYYNETYGK